MTELERGGRKYAMHQSRINQEVYLSLLIMRTYLLEVVCSMDYLHVRSNTG